MTSMTEDGDTTSQARGYRIKFSESWHGNVYKANKHCWLAALIKKQKNRTLTVRAEKNFSTPEAGKQWCQEQFAREQQTEVPAEQQLREALVTIRDLISKVL